MAAVSFGDLPLASQTRRWNGAAANRRVRRWAGAQEEPTARYRRAFAWYDARAEGNFTAYKLQIADIVDGELTAVPRAVISAAAVMQGSRGGVGLPPGDVSAVQNVLARYYKKMGATPPWDS